MIKSKILKRIGAGLTAVICAVTLFGTNFSGIDVHAAEVKEPLLTADEVIKQAATYLGVPYGWDCKGYDGVYSSNSPTKQSIETVRSKGLDCSGLVYATLTDLGVRTTGFSSNNPVPINYWETWDGSAFTNCTMTYKGVTSKIEILVDKQNGNTDYFSSGKLVPGAVVSGIADEGGVGHMWFYMGQFKDRNAVLDYLVKLGYSKDKISPYVGDGKGKGGVHWRIECNGSQGCVINNNTDGKSLFKSFVAYRFTSRTAKFTIKKCITGSTQIVGKSSVDGSTAKYGVYSDKACKTKVGEIKIGEKGTGSTELNSGTYYVKEISAPKGYALSDKVYELSADKTINVYEDYQTGTIRINKTAEDNEVKGLEFKVTGSDGSSYTKKTTTVGKVDFTGLKVYDLKTGKPITYTVSEINTAKKYIVPKAQNVTLTGGNVDLTVNVNFKNELVKGILKIRKMSEDDQNGDRTFEVKGNGKTYTIKTDGDGMAVLTDLPVYGNDNNKIVYTIYEKDVPIKYVVPAEQTVALIPDTSVGAIFKNVLKKFTAEITKKDAETGTAQGDGKLSGAVYGLYLDGKLVDEYTTDDNGCFKTKEYPCGNYIIKEISPSEGYTLDPTEYPVGAEEKNYTLENNSVQLTVNEQPVKGKINILKHSDDGDEIENLEEGAEFEVFLKSAGSYESAAESVKDYLTTDKDGRAETKLLPYGIYTVHQTKTVNDAEFVQNFDVYISENGKTYEYVLNNTPFRSYIHITKLDAETGKVIPYEGAGFQIYDNSGNLVNMGTDTFYTNSEGYIITPETLKYGDYTLVEVQAPYGYVLDDTPVSFNVSAANAEIENAVNIIKVEKSNIAQKGRISVTKRGDVFASVTALGSAIYADENGEVHESGENIYTPVFEEQGLEGAVYQITAAEDITTPDGTVRVSEGDVVAELTTDEEGYAQTDLLYLGKYEIREIEAPEGYVLNSEPQTVELTYDGQEVEIKDSVDTTFVNDYQKLSVGVKKILETDDTYGVGTNDEYKSVRFGLFAAEDIAAADGNTIPENGLVSAVYLDDDMTAVIAEKVPFGNYYVQEIASDEHYIISDTKFDVSFEYQGQDTDTVYIDGGDFENALKRGRIEGVKVNESGEPLEGAVFGIFKADCEDFTEETAIVTVTSDKDGKFAFEDVPYGEYLVKEISAPDGFVLDENAYPFMIENDGDSYEITNGSNGFVNVSKKGSVEITKTDISTGAAIPNCGIEILDKDGNVLIQGRTDENGVVTFNELVVGDYFYREFDAPDGYILDDKPYPFTIKENGEIVKCSMTNERIPTPETPFTGDDASKLPAFIFIGASVVIASVLYIGRKRKTNRNKHNAE